jgi:SAM-dependent methyltransferase
LTFDSASYWERRYRRGGNSGSGSFGHLASFKAEVLNSFVSEFTIEHVLELGCGDGHQLMLARYPRYTGIDVSKTAISHCKAKFSSDPTKRFTLLNEVSSQVRADLSLSLDVVFHLVEDDVSEAYMARLFSSASRFVCIYSSNFVTPEQSAPHVRHRRFTDWIAQHQPAWRPHLHIPNRFPYYEQHPDTTSFADFYFYEHE